MKLINDVFDIVVNYRNENLQFALREPTAAEVILYAQRIAACKSPKEIVSAKCDIAADIIDAFPDTQFVDENNKPIKCNTAGKNLLKKKLDFVLINICYKYVDQLIGIDIAMKQSDDPLLSSSVNGAEIVQLKKENNVS